MSRAAGSAGELLDERTVAAYLVRRGLVSPDAPVRVRTLGGGVSNIVLAVDGDGRRLVVKQALERLRVEQEWRADPRRAVTEARALQRAAGVLADSVPGVADVDEEACALVIERAPASWTDWKVRLLRGDVNPAVGEQVGRALGALHADTFNDPAVERTFAAWEDFEALRIRPYHGTVARHHPVLAPVLEAIVERMKGRRRCLVHGDCSPKNVLVGPDGIWLIDFEVAHHGDPTFDVAFLASHLMLKAVHQPAARARLRAALDAFLAGYRGAAGGADLLDAEPWLVRGTAALMLARVDGKSPVEYLQAEDGATVRALATHWLDDPPDRIDGVWLDLEEALA